MNSTPPPDSPSKANKLIIRSEVLAVIRHLASVTDLPKAERVKHTKRLQDIPYPQEVQEVLVKELARTAQQDVLQVISQLLMELGEIDFLSDRLWQVIRDPNTSDEVKDASNLILRHLGDSTDPDLYLEYLQDPQGLIGRETVRMLEVSSENPEALVDFIDFILSLGREDQVRLISALQHDYPSDYLVNILVPLLESDPAPELWPVLIEGLSSTKSPYAAELLLRLNQWGEDRLPIPKKQITRALKQLQIAGAYRPESPPPASLLTDNPPALIKDAEPYQCFATLSDGIGNQGLLFSRQRANGDIIMISVAINDVHGIIDCFGFFQLSIGDFHRIIEKFHEGATKIKVTPEYCAFKLIHAEQLNTLQALHPVRYRCWRPILSNIEPFEVTDVTGQYLDWVKAEWYEETNNL